MAYEATYDRAEARAIAARAHMGEWRGMPLELRPLPFSDAEDELEPRVLADARARMAGTVPSIPLEDVVAMRRRPNKESHPIAQGKVTRVARIMRFADRGIPLHVWTPEDLAAPAPVMLFLHGGGWAFGNAEMYANALAYIAEQAGCVVCYVDYRMSPECAFPGPLMDCSQAVDWVAAHAEELGVDIGRLVVAGDSAGGSLANGVVQLQAARHPVRLLVNLYGVMDASPVPEGWSYDLHPVRAEQFEEAKNRIDRTKGSAASIFYTGGDMERLHDPLISAKYCADLSMFPRSLVVACAYDYLKTEDLEFARRLWQEGRDVRAVLYLGMDHGFIERAGAYPQAEDLCDVIAEEIRGL